MRYIRTKDGLYETITTDCGWEIPVYANNDFGEKYIQEDNVVKQADTIEELCDKFVAVDKENYHWIDNSFRFLKSCVNDIGDKIYGAIWADKGLIYVAKMNDKGELELL